METALLEKNRIKDEAAAFDFALEGKTKQTEMRSAVRSLKQRRDLAKELGAKGQVRLFDRELLRTERAYRIRHENPYPECNKTDAMDAMCEPIKPGDDSAIAKISGSINANMQKSLGNAMGSAQSYLSMTQNEMLRLSMNELGAYQRAMDNEAMRSIGLNMKQAAMIYGNDPWSRGYSRQTHKYDLSCAPLNVADLCVEGSTETEVMLPMSALCRLKEAKEKNMFDHFQVWRPAEWKAPDPWLVGVHYNTNGEPHYFKVADWR